jgi:hypothetical protein
MQPDNGFVYPSQVYIIIRGLSSENAIDKDGARVI